MKRHIVLLTLFITVSNLFLSKGNTIRFKQNADGLSNSSVTYIFQDSKERMWFGTYDGVNCWDGKTMERFHKHKPPHHPKHCRRQVGADMDQYRPGSKQA